MTIEQEHIIDAARHVAIFDWGMAGMTEDYHARRMDAMNALRDTIARFLEKRMGKRGLLRNARRPRRRRENEPL